MARSKLRANTKSSGGRYKRIKGKKLKDLAGEPTLTKLGQLRVKFERVKGGSRKYSVLRAEEINVYDPKTKKYSKQKVEAVIENPANRHYVRRNILTKGTVVKTPAGNARITNRPGQEGSVNAILI